MHLIIRILNMLAQDVVADFLVDCVRLRWRVARGFEVVVEWVDFGERILHPHPPIKRPSLKLTRVKIATVSRVAQRR